MLKRIFIVLMLSSTVFAQLGIQTELTQGYSTNIFANYNQHSDYVSSAEIFVHRDWVEEWSGLRVSYRPEYTRFQKYSVRNYWLHRGGIQGFRQFGENRLTAALYASARIHSQEYKWYEYSQWSGYTEWKQRLNPQWFVYTGGNFQIRDYSAFPVFSRWQGLLYLRQSRSFNTGTSIIAEMDFMYRNYLKSKTASGVDLLPLLVTKGNGENLQWVGIFKVAQSLSKTTGLSTRLLYRKSMSSSVRYLGSVEGTYYSDDELFDTVFGFDELRLQLDLKQRLWGTILLTAGMFYTDRQYTSRLALDLSGTPLPGYPSRRDYRTLAWAGLSKSFTALSARNPLNLEIEYLWKQNHSNDPYYDYASSYFSIGLRQSF
ncbi:MAG: hypothetical protein U5R06_13480 [candidate division KSB1 bacterium]|nr:hypothetical protein [candidate division KSB1 bacterium]